MVSQAPNFHESEQKIRFMSKKPGIRYSSSMIVGEDDISVCGPVTEKRVSEQRVVTRNCFGENSVS